MQRRVLVPRATWLSAALVVTSLVAACSDEGALRRPSTARAIKADNALKTDPADPASESQPDPLAGLPTGTAQIQALCARAGAMQASNPSFTAVTASFCKDGFQPKGLEELQQALGLQFANAGPTGTNGSNNNPAFALSGHSQSLLSRSVSSVNPRAFLFNAPQGQPTQINGFVITGFARGEPYVEIAAQDRNAQKITFYLVKFDLPCGANCTNADMLTPAVEKNWTGATIYDDEDLKNTILDCRHCHQPDGPNTPMMLRMQELEDPWTHWFRSDRPGGLTLLQDYIRAHGEEEDYGGIPGALINKSDGKAFEDFVKGQGFADQPNIFDSPTIEAEVTAAATTQPEINTPRGASSTWQALYDKSARGQFIPVPYHDVKVTDPNKLQFVTNAYEAFMAGTATTLPDIRRVFLDDAMEDMTFYPKLGASGGEVLIQSCAQCHNPKLDPSISRAKFDATKIASMSAAEKKEAIKRMNLPSSDRLHMPPSLLRALPDDALAAAIKALQ